MLLSYASSGVLRDDLIVLEVCEKYGWTYQEFYNQPEEFTDLAIEKLRIENTMGKGKSES